MKTDAQYSSGCSPRSSEPSRRSDPHVRANRRGEKLRRSATPAILAGLLGVILPVERAVGEMAGMPLAVAVEGVASEDAHAFGLRIDQPIRLSENTLVLAEFRAAKGDSDFGILSGGVALRRSLGNWGGFAGVNVFYDALQDSNGFSYSQIGFGAEISHDRFILRGNGYLP